jgi:integrase
LVPESHSYFVPVVNAKGQGIQGLNVRVLPSGLKVFVHRYRFHGRQKILTLGRFPAMTPDAAEKASVKAQAQINAGEDPGAKKAESRRLAAEAKQAAFTVGELADRYIEEHIKTNNKESWQVEATRLIDRLIRPAIGNVSLKAVGPSDISALLHKIRKATPTQANRVRAVLRTMFGRAEEWELRPLGSNPVAVVKQRSPEIKRERRLSDMEIRSLGATLQGSKESVYVIAAVRLALLAGMRKGEIQALRWEWVDLDAAEIHIPPGEHKTGKKTGKARVIHLCVPLVTTLKALPVTLGCPYAIPGLPKTEGKGKQRKILEWRPFIGLQSPWERIREAAKLAVKGNPSEEDPGWHDLRRTFASIGSDLGLKGFVGELLGHAEQSVTDIYTRTAAQRLKDAVETIGARIEGILTGAIDPAKEAQERQLEKEKKAKEARHGA